MYRYKQKKGKKKERSETSLNYLARNARTFRKLSLSVRRIARFFYKRGQGRTGDGSPLSCRLLHSSNGRKFKII